MESFNRLIGKLRPAALVSLVVFQATCSTSPQDSGPVGVVRAALVSIPPDVTCVRVEVQGARFTSQDFDVTPGTDATLLVDGVSTGSVVVTAKAFGVACAAITAASVPNWVSDPVSTQVGTAGVSDVSVTMHRNGQINVGIDFHDDPACGMTGGFCAPATCSDGAKNGTESDTDCGGTCKGCQDGRHCNVAADCATLACSKGKCVPTCRNSVQDGTETDVDCGGLCGTCGPGLHCLTGSDCVSGTCMNGICPGTPTCSDGSRDGMETDVDCGGGTCGPCADNLRCATGTDCVSGTCTSGFCTTSAPSCVDGIKNGTETDVDCGGNCGTCAVGLGCSTPGDCTSGSCFNGFCAAPTCSDGIHNGPETDIDCGGSCPPCADGRCHSDKDCASNACVGGMCKASCVDGVKNGTETDVDCGGDCNPCAIGLRCQVDTDCDILCIQGICASKVCSPVSNGLVAMWRADDSFSDAIGGLNAFPVGGVTFATGIHGDGFLVDGSPGSAVEAPDAPALDLDTSLTIDAWINPTDNGGNGRIVDKIAPFGNDGYMLDMQGFQLRAIVGGVGIASIATVPANTFTHVAVTYSSTGTIALYINGLPAASMPFSQAGIPVNTHPVLFGADQGGGSPFVGVIDEVQFWNQALNGKQMQLLFKQGPVCP